MISLQALHDMPLKEKLFVMEALWDEISAAKTELAVPEWQQGILDEREAAIATGTAKFSDWEEAKIEILKAVR